MVGISVFQCAVTRMMARGCCGVPSLRREGTRVLRLWVREAWEGSLRRGMGPPPWEMLITGARCGEDMFAVGGVSVEEVEEEVLLLEKKYCWRLARGFGIELLRLRVSA